MNDYTAPQNIVINSTILVEVISGKAKVSIPPELRITEDLLNLIHAALKEQGLELAHLSISAEHARELHNLPNVQLTPEEE